jgi:hypothetical protein
MAAVAAGTTSPAAASRRHGLPPVHFSPQPEPYFSLAHTSTNQCIPQKLLTLTRKVDVRQKLPLVHLSAQPEPFMTLEPPNANTYPPKVLTLN